MPEYTLNQIAELLGLEEPEAGSVPIRGVGDLDHAGPDQLAFADSDRLMDKVRDCQAAAVLVSRSFPELPGLRLWRLENPRLGFLKVAELFVEQHCGQGVHPDASVHPDAQLGAGVSVGACAVIGAGARIGAGSCIGPGVFVGERVAMGENCLLEANASLLPGAVLGDRVIIRANAAIASEGFGFQWLGDHHHRIPQLGRVEIGDDVEIGCNSCVDRATLGVTRIGRGSKIDNQVHVAHNCDIGEHVILVAQVGLSGSVTIGANSVLAGKVGVVDHIDIGSRVTVGGRSTVTKDVADDVSIWGWPARNIKRVMREQASISRLPELVKQVNRMQQQIEVLKAQLEVVGRDVDAQE